MRIRGASLTTTPTTAITTSHSHTPSTLSERGMRSPATALGRVLCIGRGRGKAESECARRAGGGGRLRGGQARFYGSALGGTRKVFAALALQLLLVVLVFGGGGGGLVRIGGSGSASADDDGDARAEADGEARSLAAAASAARD